MQDQRKRNKILKQYGSVPDSKPRQTAPSSQNFLIKDNDDLNFKNPNQLSDSEQESSEELPQRKRQRIDSSDEDAEAAENRNKKKSKKEAAELAGKSSVSEKISRKLRRALGKAGQDQDIEEFMKEVKIQGMDQVDLKQFLKKNRKAEIFMEVDKKKKKNKKEKKVKKQKKSKRKRVESESQSSASEDSKQKLKMQMFQKSQSSDLEIPQQSRAVYRNKDGTIRLHSEKQMKEKHRQEVQGRLNEWQKGMHKQKGSSDQQSDEEVAKAKNQVFDDPMRRWDLGSSKQHKNVNPLKCKFQGNANRFDIKPGFRWDGVIRGNGYETKYLQDKNVRKMTQLKQEREYMKNL